MESIVMDEMFIGRKASRTQLVTEREVLIFAGVTGDLNPVHINPDFAEKSIFKKQIAHGMYSVSLISAVLGCELPGAGTIYLGQEINFLAPVYLGDVITAEVEVLEMNIEKNRLKLKTTCTNQENKIVAEGVATVKPPKVKAL